MLGSRFSRNRFVQAVTWLLFAVSLTVIFTGYMVGPARVAQAQTNGAEAKDNADIADAQPDKPTISV